MPVPKGPRGVKVEMKKFKAGKLHSGSKKGPIVRNRKQAIAISLSEAGLSKRQKSGQTSKRKGNQHFESETHAYNFRDHL